MDRDLERAGELERAAARPTEGFNGFVIIRLAAEATRSDAQALEKLIEEAKLRGLGAVLAKYGGRIPSQRVVRSVSPKQLAELEQRARTSELPPLHSLVAYWRLDCRHLGADVEALVRELIQLPEVDLAYRELQAHDPIVNAADDPLAIAQDYLDAAPTGIDARWAWTQNRDGAGVAFIDLEQGWIANHEDLTAKAPALIFGDNRNGVGTYRGDHGTAVLGEVVGVDNTVGVVGIATGVTSVRMVSHWETATSTALHVADAIAAATVVLTAGDVLLLEVARGGNAALPTEIDAADFDAIRLAVGNGIVVVEAAGNGSRDLDAYPTAATSTLNRGNANFLDSGAIMVGAASAAVPHDRLGFSCFGSRIDCYGYGEAVTTLGYGDLSAFGTPDTRQYTGVFNGTSSASPIVTGAALIVQGAYKATAGTALSPLELRAILADPVNGTPQGTGLAGDIGSMPNLRQILSNALGVLPDVYLRDALGDSGAVPHSGAVSISPDIICVPAAVANPTTAFGQGSGTENVDTLGSTVEHGQDNFIYVRMKNRGAGTANGVSATVYWSEVATLVTPNTWKLVGVTAPVNVPQGNTLVVAGPLTWPDAALPLAGNHACFIAILNSAQDPAPPPLPATDWNNFLAFVRNNNNVAWRNFQVIDVLADPAADPASAAFIVAGPPDGARFFDLRIYQDLPEGVDVWWEVPPALFGQLRTARFRDAKFDRDDVRVLLPPVRELTIRRLRLGPKTRFKTRLRIHGNKGLDDGWHRIAVGQWERDREVGRVTFALRRGKERPPAPPEPEAREDRWRRLLPKAD
jgi:serine protease